METVSVFVDTLLPQPERTDTASSRTGKDGPFFQFHDIPSSRRLKKRVIQGNQYDPGQAEQADDEACPDGDGDVLEAKKIAKMVDAVQDDEADDNIDQ